MCPKICLINPPTMDPSGTFIYFPMALLTLGGVLREMGVQTDLWDFDLYFKNAGNATESQFRKLLHAGVDGAGTNVFGISAICSNLPMAIWIAKEIKAHKRNSIIVLGGPQPSSTPALLLERFDFIDVVVVGEGERTLEDLVRAGFDRRRFAEIPGIAYREGGEVKSTPSRPLVENMDDLPFPDYSLIDFKDYEPHQISVYNAHVEVGRGCPYSCTFCSTSLMWEKNFRVKSPRRILDEMTFLYERYGFTAFDFIHDNFTTSKRFVKEFCDFMGRHNKLGLKWTASSRTDCMTIDRLEEMQKVGLISLFFGIETASPHMQRVIKKGLQLENFEPVLRRINELKVHCGTSFILGFPEETREDIDQTIGMALHYKSLGTSEVFLSKLAVLTGTAYYQTQLSNLKEFSRPSSISPQKYGLPFVMEIVKKYPDLFSSFYHVPHPEFSLEYLSRLIEFGYLLLHGDTKLALMIIENLHVSSTQLFEKWDEWARGRDIPYFLCGIYSPTQFKNDFQDFFDEWFSRSSNAELPVSQVA